MARKRHFAPEGMSARRSRTSKVVSLLLFVALVTSAAADEQSARLELLRALSEVFFASDKARSEYEGKAHKCVVLSETGIVLPQLVGLRQEAETTLASVIDKRAIISAYDSVAAGREGMVSLKDGRSLYTTWREILSDCKPNTTLLRPRSAGRMAAERFLYRRADKVDVARGISYLQEPSEAYRRYLNYRDLFALIQSQSDSDSTWRMMPSLDKYKSLKAAKAGIWDDWVRFGYKIRVEEALDAVIDDENSKVWRDWNAAEAAWTENAIGVNMIDTFGRTYLFPQPENWASMASWTNIGPIATGDLAGAAFQCARIQIFRPWFRVEDMLSGRLSYRANANAPLSKGRFEYPAEFPTGRMPIIIQELILVRNVRTRSGDASSVRTPLSQIAYPDAINLVGYVVLVLTPDER